jgi:hypothetical protein
MHESLKQWCIASTCKWWFLSTLQLCYACTVRVVFNIVCACCLRCRQVVMRFGGSSGFWLCMIVELFCTLHFLHYMQR